MSTEIALIILAQLGGNKFTAMTGAKNYLRGKNSLQFNIPRNKTKANRCTIILNADDTYTMEFWKIRGINASVTVSIENFTVENLREIFTSQTGFYLSI